MLCMATSERAAPASAPDRIAGVCDQFDDASLLVLALCSGRDAEDPTPSDLLTRFGGLSELMHADGLELRRAGASDPMIDQLAVFRELAVRLAREAASARPVVSSWSQLLAYLRTALCGLPREQFRALYLDRRNRLMRAELVADGTIDFAPVFPREIVRRALELNASAMILVHNHPSGDPSPSTADVEMTRKVVDAARVFGISVHDHVVVGREATASFKTLGLM